MSDLVLLTGGVGFIGRHTADVLRRKGFEVRALDLLSPQVHRDADHAVRQFGGEVLTGDVRDVRAVASAMAGAAAVVHLAAETGVGQSMYEVDRYVSVNVGGTRNVLDEAGRRGLPVVVASSRAVYGAGAHSCEEHGRTCGPPCCAAAGPSASVESDPAAPVSVYGETKSDAERLVRDAISDGTSVVAIRPQNVIGAGQALHNPYTGVLAAFAARLRQGLPPLVYGTGEQTRDFIAVQDVAHTISWLLDNPAVWPAAPVLNVGSGERATLLDLARSAITATGVDVDVEHVDVTRPGDIEHACADLTLADSVGLPRASWSLADSVAEFIRFAESEEPVDPGIWNRALGELSEVETP